MLVRIASLPIVFVLSLASLRAQGVAHSLERELSLLGSLPEIALLPPGERLASFPKNAASKPMPVRGGKEFLLARVEGPGCLVRLWCEDPAGKLFVRIDGEDEPIVSLPLRELFQGKPEWVQFPLVREAGGCGVFEYPLLFARSIEVTTDRAELRAHLDLRLWDAGTKVTSHRRDAARAAIPAMEHVARGLMEVRRFHLPLMKDFVREEKTIAAEGKTGFFQSATEGSKLASLSWISLEFPKEKRIDAALLSKLFLVARFDGVESVDVPLGAFHAHGAGLASWHTLTLGMEEKGLLCSRWPMPFRKKVELALRNASGREVVLRFGVGVRELPGDQPWGRFHARGFDLKSGKGTVALAELPAASRLRGVHLDLEDAARYWTASHLRLRRSKGEAPLSFGPHLGAVFGQGNTPQELGHDAFSGVRKMGKRWALYRGFGLEAPTVAKGAALELVPMGAALPSGSVRGSVYWYEPLGER